MNTLETITEFFGWCTVINMVLLMLATILIIAIRKPSIRLHGKMFNLDDKDLCRAYFTYLGNYKIATIVFCMVPYIALKLMA